MADTRSVLTLTESRVAGGYGIIESIIGMESAGDTPYGPNFGVAWAAMLGDQIRVGVSLRYAISGGASSTIRVRVGGESGADSSVVTGTVILEEVVTGVGQLSVLSDLVTKPTNLSYVKLTAQNSIASAYTSYTSAITIQPEANSSALFLQTRGRQGIAEIETIIGQWAVNFDLFSTPNLIAAIAVRLGTPSSSRPPAEGSICRLRIGGTWNTIGGSVVASATGNYLPNEGQLEGAAEEIVCPSGTQIVTVTAQLLANWRYYSCTCRDISIMFEGSGTPTAIRPMITFSKEHYHGQYT